MEHEDFTVCNDCRKKLCEATDGMGFEQYSLAWSPRKCQLCKVETTNWFTPHGIIMLKRAIEKAQINGNL